MCGKWKIILVATTLFLSLMGAAFEFLVRPTVLWRAEAETKRRTNVALLQAAQSVSVDLVYEDIVQVDRNEQGEILAIRVNAQEMNSLAFSIAQQAQNLLAEEAKFYLQIPLGSFFGAQTMAGKGPVLTFLCGYTPSVSAAFSSEFSSAGINQTRHRITANISAWVNMAMPGHRGTVEVSMAVPICETILVGNVPDTFLTTTQYGTALNLAP